MRKYTIRDFRRDFPDDAVCLEWLRNFLYPNGIECPLCKRVTKHHRVKSRPSYSCDFCGHHVHPAAGTIFEKSTTPLHLWFYAIFQMSATRCGMSAKQIQRELGVTYKTAWRMWSQIRKLLAENVGTFSGPNPIEADETYIGGRRSFADRRDAARNRLRDKSVVAGQVQRQGKLRATYLPEGAAGTLVPHIRKHILPSSIIYTDELPAYKNLSRAGYIHRRVNHSAKVYVRGGVHTNTIEGFFGLLKRGISGVYHSVSAKYLQRYLDEYAFRYNHRNDETPMFTSILRRVADVPAGPPSQGLS